MLPKRLPIAGVLVGIAAAAFAPRAQAVIVGSGDGTENTTQGSMPAGWNNVGTIDGASGVYLGNQWGITAAHVGSIGVGTQFTIGSQTYTVDATATRLQNSDSTDTDLQMFHLAANPNLAALSPLTLGSSTPSSGTSIYMVGYGRSPRDVNPTYYSVTGSGAGTTWTPVANSASANAGGFGYDASTTAKRWGTNLTRTDPNNPTSPTVVVNAGFGNTTTLISDFYTNLNDYVHGGGTAFEAQVSPGDSGGGVFDSSNHLVGLINYESTFINQPANTAVFGDLSYMADLSTYQGQIDAVLATPEPSTLGLLLVGVPFLLRRGRRRVSQ